MKMYLRELIIAKRDCFHFYFLHLIGAWRPHKQEVDERVVNIKTDFKQSIKDVNLKTQVKQ